MSIILLENDKKIKNLFHTMFSSINFYDNNQSDQNIINYESIKNLLSTDEIRTNEMLDEIHKVLINQYSLIEVNNIYINHGIITNRNNPNFSILSNKNSLSRSLEQASFYKNSFEQPKNNLSIIRNNISNHFINGYPYVTNPVKFESIYEQISIPMSSQENQFDNSILIEKQKPYIESFENVSSNNGEQIPQQGNASLTNYTEYQQVPERINIPLEQTPVQVPQQGNASLSNYTQYQPVNQNIPINNNQEQTCMPLSNFTKNQQVTQTYYYNNEELNNKLASLQNEIANIKSKSDIDCESKINEVKTNLNNEINDIKNKSKDSIDNYVKLLTDVLLKNQVITQNEVNNMNKNVDSGLIDINTVINYLESKKKLAKNLTINFNFDKIYLDKWNVPLPRPPICISDNPVRVKQSEEYSTNFAPYK